MNKIPLYFNFTGKYPDLLKEAINSIPSKFQVIVNHEEPVKPFTYCLNKILNTEKNDIWFFMHYDARILDKKIFDLMLNKYYEDKNNTASVCACNITDLLILIDSDKIKKIGGWDPLFLNSYMELDLRNRIFQNGYSQHIIYDNDCPIEIDHSNASKLREKSDKEYNLYSVYLESLKNDILRFKEKYPEQGVDLNLLEAVLKESW
jgi:hypothetical protein